MRWHLNITGKLVLFMVCLLLLKGTLTILWMSSQMRGELVSRELDDLGHDASLVSLNLKTSVEDSRILTLAMADVPPIQGIARSREHDGVDPTDGSTETLWRRRLEVIFRSILNANPDITQLRYIGVADDGLELVRVERARAGAPVRIVPESELQKKGDRPYFQSALSATAGTVYISDIELNQEHGKIAEPHVPVIRTGTPAYDDRGELFGALVLNLDMGRAFSRAVDDTPEGRELYIANTRGDYLVNPDPTKAFGFDLGHPHKVAEDFPALEQGKQVTREGATTSELTHTAGGSDVAVAFSQAEIDPINPDRKLFVMMSTDYAALAAHPDAVLRRTVVGALGFLAFAIGIGLVLARRFARPIRALSASVAALERGNLSARAEIHSNDEVGALSSGFNRMAESLQEKQRELETRAEGLETRMAAVVNTAGDAIITTDENNLIESCNPATARIFGYSTEELLGRDVRKIMPRLVVGTGVKNQSAPPFPGFASQIGQTREIVGLRKNGTVFPVALAVSETRVGEQHLFTGIARDITEAKKMHEVLQKAKEVADAANHAKSDFLAVMSHELRTPLNGVIGMTELLLGAELDERQRHHASLAKLSADTLLSLINDILDFSKIEAGEVELETIDFDLRQAIEAVASSLTGQAEEKGLELIAFVDPLLNPLRCGDPGRLQQILLNLANNSIKFTESGEVVIEIREDPTSQDDSRVRVTIRDTGVGIPESKIGGLFNRFAQVDASTTRKYGGTGLGLAICKHLVELMGGEIGVESTLGEGSTFWFTLQIPSQSEEAAPEGPDLTGHRVIVVDDNETNRSLLAEHLAALGISHATASGPEEALRLLTEEARAGRPFDVGYLDMNMPGMNGMDLARAIKSDPMLRDIALILLGSSKLHDANRLRKAGFSCWLSKPIRQTQVIEYIRKATNPDAIASEQIAATNRSASKEPIDMSKHSILVAEDDEISQEVVSCLLETRGATFKVVENGVQAVEAALTKAYDLILMDGQMPEMDGFEATRTIRAHEEEHGGLARNGGRLPIVALTANAIKGDRERCLDAGMDEYLSKPLSPKRLFEKIATVLAGEQGVAEMINEPASSGSPEETPAINLQDLLERWEGMNDLVHRVLTRFETQAPEALAEIEQAIETSNSDSVRQLAHKLKGSAGYASAVQVQRIAAELQSQGELGELEHAKQSLESLRIEIARCLKEIPAVIQQMSSTPGGRPVDSA